MIFSGSPHLRPLAHPVGPESSLDDVEHLVDGGCAESGERESPRRVGDDAPRDAVGVELDEEFPAADRRLYAVELCALLV